MAGILVALAIRYLPGRGGHSPADGFHADGAPSPRELPGVFVAALATLSLGVVLGPEAPLIALGGGLGALAVDSARRNPPDQARAVIASAGSFAAIATLFGSPLPAAFLLMEAAGLGGAKLRVVLLPGLLAAGIGALLFIGLDSLTGLETTALTLPGLPSFGTPTVAMFGWAIGFGVSAAVVGSAIRSAALFVRPYVEERILLLTPAVGLMIALLAIIFAESSDRGTEYVLFSGQNQLPSLISGAADWSVSGLVLLIVCKSVAYSLSLSSFRGGPVFPALFIGAAGGVAAANLPGLSLVPAVAIGMGAMACAMLKLPLTSVMLATLFLGSDGFGVMPLVIVAVVVTFVVSARLQPEPAAEPSPRPPDAQQRITARVVLVPRRQASRA